MTLLQNTSIFEGVNLNNTVQKSSQQMSETVSGLKGQLINPLKSVTSSVQAGIATISEAQSVLTQNLSTYKSQAIEGINNTLKNLSGGFINNMADLGSLVKYEDGFKLDTDALLRLGSKGLGFNVNSMRELKDDIANGFMDELNSMTFGLADGLFIIDTDGNGIKLHTADDWKLNMGNQLIEFIGKDDPDGFGSVVNVAGMNAILNTMLNQSIKNGIWQGYDRFNDMYVFQSDYHDALINGIDIAISKGDLESINTILNIIQTEGANKVNAKYPNLVEQLLTNFTFNRDVDPSQYPELQTKMLSVFTAVAGNDWYKYPTQFGMAINVGLTSFISESSKTLLIDVPDLAPLLCSAGMFVEQSAIETFTGDFPNAVVFS